MGITRVELHSNRSGRRRDSGLLRATVRRVRELDSPNDTVLASSNETEAVSPAPIAPQAAGGLSDEELRRELNLTRALHLSQPHEPTSSGSSTRSDAKQPRSPKTTGSDSNGIVQPQPIDPDKKPANGGESRLDLITGEWTLYATTRAQRPDQFAGAVTVPNSAVDCPFCTGNEHRTPNPVWSAKLDDDDDDEQAADWSVRVVPNLYPAVTDVGACQPTSPATLPSIDDEVLPLTGGYRPSGAGASESSHFDLAADSAFPKPPSPAGPQPSSLLFPNQPSLGGHEVIIESPRHTESFSELNTAEMAMVFTAYSQRIRHWQTVPGIEHVSIFKNVGRDAGASLQHSHSQLIATSQVPTVVQQVTHRMQAHYARTGSCMQCDLVRGELRERSRLVSQTDSFVAFCPYASRLPLQVRVTSKEHLACFSELRPPHLSEAARLVLRIVRWLEALRPGTAYNVLLHTCPVKFEGARESHHWALDVFPRMSRLAGFELATGAMINPIFPESSAKAFREQARLSDPRYVLR